MNRNGTCTVRSLGRDGNRVGLYLGEVEHCFDEERAREVYANLGEAIERAWPKKIPWIKVEPQWPDDEERWCADIGLYSLFASSRGHWYVMYNHVTQYSGCSDKGLDDAKLRAHFSYDRLRGEP